MSLKGKIEQFECEGKLCTAYIPLINHNYSSDYKCFAIAYIYCGEEWSNNLYNIAQIFEDKIDNGICKPACIVSFSPIDWNKDFTPWPAPLLTKKSEPFSGNGNVTLNWLLHKLKPEMEKRYNVSNKPADNAILGYSLGGLMALWTLYNCDCFANAASCSGSLWYDGWFEYITTHQLHNNNMKIYISLGNLEANSHNQYMSKVAVATGSTIEILKKQKSVSDILFESNEGGHFKDVIERLNKGLFWIMKK